MLRCTLYQLKSLGIFLKLFLRLTNLLLCVHVMDSYFSEYQSLYVIINSFCIILKWLQNCVHSFPSVSGGIVYLCFAFRLHCSHKTCGQRWTWDHSTGLVMSERQASHWPASILSNIFILKVLHFSSIFSVSCTSHLIICVGYWYQLIILFVVS